jgi:hypothetical protein
MKKKLLLSVLIIGISTNLFSQSNIAEANKINGFYIFVDSSPIDEYEVLGEVKVDESDKEVLKSEGQYTAIRDNIIKNARSVNYTAEGLIFQYINGGTDKAMMIKFKNKSEKNNLAKVEQFQGLYIFTDCTPTKEHKYIETVKFSGGFNNLQYSNVRDTLIKRVRKKYSDAEGIILKFVIGGNDLGDAIKF